MRHRIASGFGLGNPDPELLDNNGPKLPTKKFADEAIELYFKHWDGFDFHIDDDSIRIGIEPSYQDDPLKIISIQKDKQQSYIQTGKAWGGYGSQITSKTKHYNEYKYKSKFVKFVDKWHPILFGEKSNG